MKKYMRKIFIKNEKDNGQITTRPYNPEVDYYSYVKEYCDKGFNQLIITSEYMIKLLEYYFLERKFKLVDVVFLEEDLELEEDMSWYLAALEEDRAYYNKLINRLKFLFNTSSIDIKSITLQGKVSNESSDYMRCMIQVNGIYSLELSNDKDLNDENKKIINVIEDKRN